MYFALRVSVTYTDHVLARAADFAGGSNERAGAPGAAGAAVLPSAAAGAAVLPSAAAGRLSLRRGAPRRRQQRAVVLHPVGAAAPRSPVPSRVNAC